MSSSSSTPALSADSSGADASRSPAFLAGVFLICLCALLYQVLLSRIFSVTMWYHFAFMAISVAMFGLTAGALLIFLRPKWFPVEKAPVRIAQSCLGFSITAVLSFLVNVYLPFDPKLSLAGFINVTVIYGVLTVPFTFVGIATTLILTKFPSRVGVLYATDLAGAALGCVAAVLLLEITDGPGAIFAVAALGALSAVLFLPAGPDRRGGVFTASAGLTAVLGVIAIMAAIGQAQQKPLLPLRYVKGFDVREVDPILYEKWNAYAHVKVMGFPEKLVSPTGWGISENYTRDHKMPQLHVVIDNSAGTILTGWDGESLEDIDYLKYDSVNLAHHLRRNADTLAVGVGGGRDLLSALAFEQNSVVGVEINHDLVRLLTDVFREFSGNLANHPKVNLVLDEARSYIARTEDRFDILQVSLIDTWAATAAGAFVLSENGLYTLEGWRLFLNRLKPNGILTFSRWYYAPRPAEAWRLVALGAAALRERGVEDPQQHMLAATTTFKWGDILVDENHYVVTLLVSPEPFSTEDVAKFRAVCEEMNFRVILGPNFADDEELAMITGPDDPAEFLANYPLNIAPPTDDNAFFFHLLRFRDLLNREMLSEGVVTFNNKALTALAMLLAAVIFLAGLGLVLPLVLARELPPLVPSLPHFLYFSGIGMGFMLVEISQMQKLNIFLGHPIYSLSLTLFALLLSSGIGSYTTQKMQLDTLRRSGATRLAVMLVVLILCMIATRWATGTFMAAPTPARLIIATLLIFPMGFMMGMAFPIGMMAARFNGQLKLTPWLWGLNGSMSVLASVLAIWLAIFSGVTTAYWVGIVCYVGVLVAFLAATRQRVG